MITARLVGDDAVLAWLRATPDAVASGLARAITTLGIELQRKIQENALTGQTLAARSGSLGSSTSLQLDQSDDRIAATVSSDSEYAHAHGYGAVGVGAKLRRITKAFGRPRPRKAITVRSDRRRIDIPKPSFLSSALEDMNPAIRDEVEAALREALTR
jgi:phage gpG-like protein